MAVLITIGHAVDGGGIIILTGGIIIKKSSTEGETLNCAQYKMRQAPKPVA
jgi:hypothetical protein